MLNNYLNTLVLSSTNYNGIEKLAGRWEGLQNMEDMLLASRLVRKALGSRGVDFSILSKKTKRNLIDKMDRVLTETGAKARYKKGIKDPTKEYAPEFFLESAWFSAPNSRNGSRKALKRWIRTKEMSNYKNKSFLKNPWTTAGLGAGTGGLGTYGLMNIGNEEE